MSFIWLANVLFFIYIVCEQLIYSSKFRHMKPVHHHHLGETATTILLAISFLGLVMFLSYLFMISTVK